MIQTYIDIGGTSDRVVITKIIKDNNLIKIVSSTSLDFKQGVKQTTRLQ